MALPPLYGVLHVYEVLEIGYNDAVESVSYFAWRKSERS